MSTRPDAKASLRRLNAHVRGEAARRPSGRWRVMAIMAVGFIIALDAHPGIVARAVGEWETAIDNRLDQHPQLAKLFPYVSYARCEIDAFLAADDARPSARLWSAAFGGAEEAAAPGGAADADGAEEGGDPIGLGEDGDGSDLDGSFDDGSFDDGSFDDGSYDDGGFDGGGFAMTCSLDALIEEFRDFEPGGF